jgi:hypothetical protein
MWQKLFRSASSLHYLDSASTVLASRSAKAERQPIHVTGIALNEILNRCQVAILALPSKVFDRGKGKGGV